MEYAGFSRRLGAYLLDVIPITLLTAGFLYIFLGFDQTVHAYLEERTLEKRIQFLAERNQIRDLSFVIWLLYSMLLEGTPLQGTIGKVICGIQVVDESGNRLTMARSIGRNLAKLLSYLPCGVGFLWAAFGSKKQAWHDKIARTYVTCRGEKPPPGPTGDPV